MKRQIRQKRRGCWQQVVYCVPASESKRQRWLTTYAARDQLNQTHGGTQAHFHTLIHLCSFTNSFQCVVIKCRITLRKYFKVIVRWHVMCEALKTKWPTTDEVYLNFSSEAGSTVKIKQCLENNENTLKNKFGDFLYFQKWQHSPLKDQYYQ